MVNLHLSQTEEHENLPDLRNKAAVLKLRGLCTSPPIRKRYLTIYGDILDVSQRTVKGEGDAIISWTEARDTAVHGTRNRVAPHKKNNPA